MTGPVGGGSHVEYGATGDVVNTAARLQSEARVGSVLVGPTARAQVRELFHWSDPTAVELRGKNQVLHVAVAAGPRGDAPGPAASRAVVRRSSDGNGSWRWRCELDRLAGGVGVAVVIEGEAGIGRPGSSRPSVNGHAQRCLARRHMHLIGLVHAVRPGGATPRLVGAVPERWPPRGGSGACRARRRPRGAGRSRRRPDTGATGRLRRAFACRPPTGDRGGHRRLRPIRGSRTLARDRGRGPALVRRQLDRGVGAATPLSASEPIAFPRRGQRPTPARPLRSTDSHMGTTSSGSDSTRCRPEPIVTWWSRWSARVPPPALFARILDVGAGNPFFIGELVRSLIDAGALVPAEDGGPSRATSARRSHRPSIACSSRGSTGCRTRTATS